ncbi:MAG: hypothetical protein MUF48_12025 [Pirellulaceae bacterium]|nr:hypothetical protein [Pirellulaceae bacterium]
MKLCASLALVLVLLFAAVDSAQEVDRVRVVLPAGAPQDVTHVARVFARQVAQRCETRVVTDEAAPLVIELALVPGIGPDGFRIEDRPGEGIRICAERARGLLYGVGKLLRTSRFERGGFSAGSWRGTSVPDKPVRGIYFATHFHNYYHDAPIEEVQRYVEDIGLWGYNTLLVWYDMHHFQGFDSREAVEFRQRLQAILGAARRLGLDVGFACVANEGYANSPEALRADVTGMRGAAFASDICTATAEGSRYVLGNFAELFDWAADLQPKWFLIWPYDSGGCGCARCQPWGHGGFLRCAQPLAHLARHKFPDAQVVLSTWFFTGEEWAGLRQAFASRPDWHTEHAPRTAVASRSAAGGLPGNQHGRLVGLGWIRRQSAPDALRPGMAGSQGPVAGWFSLLRGHFRGPQQGVVRAVLLGCRYDRRPDVAGVCRL